MSRLAVAVRLPVPQDWFAVALSVAELVLARGDLLGSDDGLGELLIALLRDRPARAHLDQLHGAAGAQPHVAGRCPEERVELEEVLPVKVNNADRRQADIVHVLLWIEL
jgi:hypothetical protein